MTATIARAHRLLSLPENAPPTCAACGSKSYYPMAASNQDLHRAELSRCERCWHVGVRLRSDAEIRDGIRRRVFVANRG